MSSIEHILWNISKNNSVEIIKHLKKCLIFGYDLTEDDLRYMIRTMPHAAFKYLLLFLSKPSLTILKLNHCGVWIGTATNVRILLEHSSLIKLYLRHNIIDCASVREIIAGLHNSSLIKLNLASNYIGSAGVKHIFDALADPTFHTSLASINLSHNCIEIEGAKEIATGLIKTAGTNLFAIKLGSNEICDEGMGYIAAALPLSSLRRLDLCDNKIGYEGAKDIAAALPLSSLLHLGLSCNKIGYEGAKEIVMAAANSSLTSLRLYDNDMSDYEQRKIVKLLKDTFITHFYIGEIQTIYELVHNVTEANKEKILLARFKKTKGAQHNTNIE